MANIKKIKLSNGLVYSIYDDGALRLNEQNQLVTGNSIIDNIIIKGHVEIVEIDDIPVDQAIHSVLVEDALTGRVAKRSINQLLTDIGGISCSVEGDVFSIKIGK